MCVYIYIYIYIYIEREREREREHIFIHSSVDRHLGCFLVLATVNSAAMNIGVHVSFQIRVFSGYMPRSEIAELYDNSFSFLKSLPTVLHRASLAAQQ